MYGTLPRLRWGKAGAQCAPRSIMKVQAAKPDTVARQSLAHQRLKAPCSRTIRAKLLNTVNLATRPDDMSGIASCRHAACTWLTEVERMISRILLPAAVRRMMLHLGLQNVLDPMNWVKGGGVCTRGQRCSCKVDQEVLLGFAIAVAVSLPRQRQHCSSFSTS